MQHGRSSFDARREAIFPRDARRGLWHGPGMSDPEFRLPQSVIDAYEEERARIDGYKGPLFRAVAEILTGIPNHGEDPEEEDEPQSVSAFKKFPWKDGDVPMFDAPMDQTMTRMRTRDASHIKFDINLRASIEALRDIPKMPSVEDLISETARRIVRELEGKNIPAAELTDEQKCAIFTLAGYMKFENGRMVSIRPVGIADDGKGGYFVGIAPVA